jgi:hypothetical protein
MSRIMSRRQDGQALVGALVVTTLAFLMAGTVAVGASALMSQESNSHNGSSRDLAAQDALAAAVAGVAGNGSAGGAPPCSQPTVFTPTTLPSNGFLSAGQCIRADGIAAGALTQVRLNWSRGCPVLMVSSTDTAHLLIWFTAAGNASAWVDSDNGPDCRQSSGACSDRGSGVIHLLDCDNTENQGEEQGSGNGLYLHVQNSVHSPVMVRLAQYSSSGGSIYVLAAPTGVPGGPAYEVADIWVSPDGATTALRLEDTL